MLASKDTAKRVSPSLVAFDWIHPEQLHLSNDPNQTSQVSFPASYPMGGSSSHLAGHPHLQWVWGESCGGQVLGLGNESEFPLLYYRIPLCCPLFPTPKIVFFSDTHLTASLSYSPSWALSEPHLLLENS